MRLTRTFAATALVVGVAVVPLAAAQANDAHHPERAGAQGAAAAMPDGMMGDGMAGGGMMQGMQGMMGGGQGAGMMARMHGGLMEFLPHAAMRGDLSLTPDQARDLLEARLIRHGNDRLRVGAVKSQDGAIVATVETVDGSAVRRLRVDPKTGMMQPVE